MSKQYEISEKDVDVMLRHLELTDPENATRERARTMLEDYQAGLHGIGHSDPEKLLKLQAEIEASKKKEPRS